MFSLVSLGLALTLHLKSGSDIARPISFELAERNWLAWLLVGSLAALSVLLAAQLFAHGLAVRAHVLGLVVPLLFVIAATAPRTPVHELAFGALVAGVGLWFLVLAVEIGSALLLTASALIALVLPVLGVLLPGLAQKLFIVYGVVAVNLVVRGIDRVDRPLPW